MMILTFSVPAIGAIYKYGYNKGIVHYTDNLATIPAEYQTESERDTDLQSLPSPTQPVPQTAVTSPAGETQPSRQTDTPVMQKVTPAAKNDPADTKSDAAKRNSLLEKSKQLDREYQNLLKQRRQLDESRTGLTESASIQAYNELVRQLNEKIDTYRQKRKALETEIKSFNDSLP